MKKILLIIAVGMMFLASCTGVKSASYGLENEAYLEFLGNPSNYSGGVNVTIDEKNTIVAEVNNPAIARPKGKVYAISTGNHSITVSYNSKVLFQKQIFVSSQETKKITLP